MWEGITSSASERVNNAPPSHWGLPFSWKDICGDQHVVQSGSLSTTFWAPASPADHPDKGTRKCQLMGHHVPLSHLVKCRVLDPTPRGLQTKDLKSMTLTSSSGGTCAAKLEHLSLGGPSRSPKTQDWGWQDWVLQVPQRELKNIPQPGSNLFPGLRPPWCFYPTPERPHSIRSLPASLGGPTSSSRSQGVMLLNNVQGKGICLQQNVSQKGLTFHILT